MNRPGALIVVLMAGAVAFLLSEQILIAREWLADRRFLKAKQKDLDRGVLPSGWDPKNIERLRRDIVNTKPPLRRGP